MHSGEEQFEPLEEALGYRFRDRELLRRALTHSSFRGGAGQEGVADNERLEFFGDAILDFIVSEELFRITPPMPEGKLSRVRSNLVRAESFHRVALRLQLGEYLILGPGEENTGGRAKPALLAGAVEALVAAIYLDGGIEPVERFVLAHLWSQVEDQGIDSFAAADWKTTLQEFLQARHLPPPRYHLAGARGPDHRKTFLVELWLQDRKVAEGRGASKKAAEQGAAQHAVSLLEAEEAAPESKTES